MVAFAFVKLTTNPCGNSACNYMGRVVRWSMPNLIYGGGLAPSGTSASAKTVILTQ